MENSCLQIVKAIILNLSDLKVLHLCNLLCTISSLESIHDFEMSALNLSSKHPFIELSLSYKKIQNFETPRIYRFDNNYLKLCKSDPIVNSPEKNSGPKNQKGFSNLNIMVPLWSLAKMSRDSLKKKFCTIAIFL